MVRESLEMEPLREKLLRQSLDGSFSDSENEDDDIIVHTAEDGPSNEDRHLLDEDDEREKLLTKKRNKILIGSRHARKKSVESYMEDGNVSDRGKPRRSKVTSPDRCMTNVSIDDVHPNGYCVVI
jgi:D-tyrosyl-tRNA(Tyr) deacylase